MNLALYCALAVLAFVTRSEGYNCYDDSCSGTAQSQPCKTSSNDFGPSLKKYNCPSGCKYWTIKDENGRPIHNQPFVSRRCWDVYHDGDKYKAETCTETREDGRVDRVCVCAGDWCNGPENDAEFESMSSSPKQFASLWITLTFSMMGIYISNKLYL